MRRARLALAASSLVAALAFGAAGCDAPIPPSKPTADILRVDGAWSFCAPGLDLERENHDALQSEALLARAATPYDVIVVPGYTPTDADKPLARVHPVAAARLDEALVAYREGKAGLVLVSGGRVRPAGTPHTEALAMKRYLLERGLSESAIVVEPCARHSTTNLRNAGRFMLKYHLRTALIVTSRDQAFYFGKGRLSSFEVRSHAELGYMVGTFKNLAGGTLEFAPNGAVMRRGTDPEDP